jgi:NAD(P)-dependent dehydrogenase (short-subunit alcohol dehydrogenase family)
VALILVTGASTGLGLATAATLAASGHDVVVHARNEQRLRDIAGLDEMHGVIYGDLSRLHETQAVADRANAIGRFDAVIHNAGMFRGADVLAVNAVAPFVLTALMRRPARSIYLSSGMHMSGSARLAKGKLTSRSGATYSDSKLYVTALAMAVAARWPDVMAHAVDPGWVPTRMGGPSAPDSLEEGHRTQVWLATAESDEISPRSGGYWYHGRVHATHSAAIDPQFQRNLILALEEDTGIVLP